MMVISAHRQNQLRPTSIQFEPSGEFLACGFANGQVKFLHVETFEDAASFAPSSDAIIALRFSASGAFMAGYDSSNHVLLFKR